MKLSNVLIIADLGSWRIGVDAHYILQDGEPERGNDKARLSPEETHSKLPLPAKKRSPIPPSNQVSTPQRHHENLQDPPSVGHGGLGEGHDHDLRFAGGEGRDQILRHVDGSHA